MRGEGGKEIFVHITSAFRDHQPHCPLLVTGQMSGLFCLPIENPFLNLDRHICKFSERALSPFVGVAKSCEREGEKKLDKSGAGFKGNFAMDDDGHFDYIWGILSAHLTDVKKIDLFGLNLMCEQQCESLCVQGASKECFPGCVNMG